MRKGLAVLALVVSLVVVAVVNFVVVSSTSLRAEQFWSPLGASLVAVAFLVCAAAAYGALAWGYQRAQWNLLEACEKGDLRLLGRALLVGVDVNEPIVLGGSTHNALWSAVCAGHAVVVERLLNHGADPTDGPPFVWRAVENGDTVIAEMLLNRGADINATNYHGETPIEEALRGGKRDAYDMLVARGAKKVQPDLRKAAQDGLIDHAKAGNRSKVEFLIAHGAVVEADVFRGALAGGRKEMLDLLAEQRDPSELDLDLESAFLEVAKEGNCAAVEWLLDHGVEVNVRDDDKRTALHWAGKAGDTDMIQTLVVWGRGHVDFGVKDRSGWTPFILANLHKHYDAAKTIAYLRSDREPFIKACLHPEYKEIKDDRWFSAFEELPRIDALREEGKREDALELCRESLGLYPDSFLFYLRAAALYDDLGKPGEAEEILQKGLSQSRSKCSIAARMGDRAAAAKDYRGAIQGWIIAGVLQIEAASMVDMMPFLKLASVCEPVGMKSTGAWLIAMAGRANRNAPVRFEGAKEYYWIASAARSAGDGPALEAIAAFHRWEEFS